ncbi:DUF2919 family protein [Paraglaciecola aquimarina]|uniref:DUF2919 family protein n=1 Tax=Paraglaciecola aquimarina TaxID=1235557 RepID=A0ABU3SZP1_9ALTE|nr:DUF2919 family protein [Paraglaciecola aquimarina]MDU0355473.1 DUF2919 family protein [Paraglaciecola aquimarina]
MLLISSLADLGAHVFFAHLQHWQFSWIIAFTLLIDIFCLYYLSRDKHISFMLQDWRKAENHLAPVT